MKHEQQIAELHGPFSAIFTPFDSSNEVNYDMLARIANYQMANGIRGFFVAGSTGEGLLLTTEERIKVVSHMCDLCRDKATIIAHVGHPSTDIAARLAIEAAKSGADWISSVTPIYHGTTFASLMRHYHQLSNATDLPFMVYSLGGEIKHDRDAQLFKLPNVCGLKYTGANFYSVQQLIRHLDEPIVAMSGFDEQFIAGQSFGFRGGIGSTFNFGAKFYAGIYENYHSGNIQEAARLQEQINRVTHLMVSYENWSYRKAIMKYLGFDCGASRAPYAPLSNAEHEIFERQLDELGILERNVAATLS